jgi:hypothetical protein
MVMLLPKEIPGRRKRALIKVVSKRMLSLVSSMTILAQTKMKFTTRRVVIKTTKKTDSKVKRRRLRRRVRRSLLKKKRVLNLRVTSQRSQKLRKKHQSSL